MKRIRISAFLLMIISLMCVIQFCYVYNSSNIFINEIEVIEEKYTNGDYENALSMCYKTFSKWKHNVGITDMFLYHDYVDEITENMEKMCIFATSEKDTEFLSVCSVIKNQIASLRNSEIPNLENII